MPDQAETFRQVLIPPLSCGEVLTVMPLINRKTTEYQERYENAVKEFYRESSEKTGIKDMCSITVLSCINNNKKFSDDEKMSLIEKIFKQE